MILDPFNCRTFIILQVSQIGQYVAATLYSLCTEGTLHVFGLTSRKVFTYRHELAFD